MKFHHNFLEMLVPLIVITTAREKKQKSDLTVERGLSQIVFLAQTEPDQWSAQFERLARSKVEQLLFERKIKGVIASGWGGLGLAQLEQQVPVVHFLHNSFSTAAPLPESVRVVRNVASALRNRIRMPRQFLNWSENAGRLLALHQKILFPSGFTLNAFENDCRDAGLTVPPDLLAVCHNGVPTTTSFGSSARNDIVFIGRIDPQKGLDVLIRAHRVYKQRGGQLDLRIYGGAPNKSYLRHLRSQLDRHSQTYLGGLNGDVVAQTYAQAKIAVFPSTFHEGLSYSLLEAMSAGAVPVITDSGGNREVVRSFTDGIVVPRNDIEALAAAFVALDADDLFRRLSAAALDRSRSFGLDASVGCIFRALNLKT